MKQEFKLDVIEGRPDRLSRKWSEGRRRGRIIVVDATPDAIEDGRRQSKTRTAMLFNVGATDDRLREEDCRNNVFHTAPTRSMLADGLASI